jgi:mRNA interferase MazF
MITSAAHQRRAGDVEISDIKQAGLPALSLVRSAKIATIEAHQVEAIGALPEPDRAAVLVELTGLLSSALLRR